MKAPAWKESLYRSLLAYAARGPVQRYLAIQAAGWLALVGVRPRIPCAASPSLTTVAVSAVVLALVLLAMGPLLNLSQPLLAAAGHLPGETWVALSVVGLVAWRHRVGATMLAAAATSQRR